MIEFYVIVGFLSILVSAILIMRIIYKRYKSKELLTYAFMAKIGKICNRNILGIKSVYYNKFDGIGGIEFLGDCSASIYLECKYHLDNKIINTEIYFIELDSIYFSFFRFLSIPLNLLENKKYLLIETFKYDNIQSENKNWKIQSGSNILYIKDKVYSDMLSSESNIEIYYTNQLLFLKFQKEILDSIQQDSNINESIKLQKKVLTMVTEAEEINLEKI